MEVRDFEIGSEFRAMDVAELAYVLTNRESVSMMVKEQECIYGNSCSLEDILTDMTPARQRFAMAAVELYRRSQTSFSKRQKISSSKDIFSVMVPLLSDLNTEEVWVLYLNQANKLIKKKRVSVGGLSAAHVDIRLILKEAFLCNATSLVLVHNHPSGNVKPSSNDDRLTHTLVEAARLMQVKCLDHVIIGRGSCYSYAEEGKI